MSLGEPRRHRHGVRDRAIHHQQPEDDPEGPVVPRRVLNVFQNYSPLMELRVGGRAIRTTAEHPFWVQGRGWLDAQQIEADDQVLSADGRWLAVDAVEGPLDPEPVYNIEVEEYHTYFVGSPSWGLSVWAHNAGGLCGGAVPSSAVARAKSLLSLYPRVVDPRTGRFIPFPSGVLGKVPQSLRAAWSGADRDRFIAEWYRRGYPTPTGGWGNYDIHHILPREFGGTNDFWNLVPVERGTHQGLFNAFWREFFGL